MFGIGVTSFGDVAAQGAQATALNTGFAASSAASNAAVSVLTPPGNEGASFRAVANQEASTQQFWAMMGLGVEQVNERVAATAADSAGWMAIDGAGAASVAV